MSPAGTFTEFAVLQEAPARHPTLRPHHIAIGLYDRMSDGALVRTHRVEVDVATARTVVPSLAGLARPELILLNDDDLGYAIVRFDERSLATLTESIGRISDGLARTVCWTAVLDMVRQAELPVQAFATILAAGMGSETSISILELRLTSGPEIVANFADPRREPQTPRCWPPRESGCCSTRSRAAIASSRLAQAAGRAATTAEQLD